MINFHAVIRFNYYNRRVRGILAVLVLLNLWTVVAGRLAETRPALEETVWSYAIRLQFRVPALVCINKADLNPARSAAIEAYCADRQVQVVAQLPYDNIVTEAMVQGQPLTAYQPDGAMARELRQLWARVRQSLNTGRQMGGIGG